MAELSAAYDDLIKSFSSILGDEAAADKLRECKRVDIATAYNFAQIMNNVQKFGDYE